MLFVEWMTAVVSHFIVSLIHRLSRIVSSSEIFFVFRYSAEHKERSQWITDLRQHQRKPKTRGYLCFLSFRRCWLCSCVGRHWWKKVFTYSELPDRRSLKLWESSWMWVGNYKSTSPCRHNWILDLECILDLIAY